MADDITFVSSSYTTIIMDQTDFKTNSQLNGIIFYKDKKGSIILRAVKIIKSFLSCIIQ